MKKRYAVDYDWKVRMVVEIDHAVMTDEKLHEINRFWTEPEYRLARRDDNIVKVVLAMLARRAFHLAMESFDVVREFSWKDGRGQEGWPAMDGSEGIKIIEVEEFDFDEEDISVTEITT